MCSLSELQFWSTRSHPGSISSTARGDIPLLAMAAVQRAGRLKWSAGAVLISAHGTVPPPASSVVAATREFAREGCGAGRIKGRDTHNGGRHWAGLAIDTSVQKRKW